MTAAPSGRMYGSPSNDSVSTPKHGKPREGSSQQSSPFQDTPSFKIVVVGDYGVGKTSLIRQLTTRQFSQQSGTTIGVEFKEHRMPDATLQLWDIAGQQYCSSMTKQYYRFASAAIVVVDVTKEASFDVALDWQRDVIAKVGAAGAMGAGTASSSPHAALPSAPQIATENQHTSDMASAIPIFLFANKSDLMGKNSSCQYNTEEKVLDFARTHGFFGAVLTSARDYESTVGAFRAVTQSCVVNVNEGTVDPSPSRTLRLVRNRNEKKKSCASCKQ